jgi:hemerythrin-like domain-containing protein
MVLIIGDNPGSDFRDPIGLLADCHRRIEKFLDVLELVAHSCQGDILDVEHRQAFEVALRYFQVSAPKHVSDEEVSLFPRLLVSAGSRLSLLSELLDRLNREHRSMSRSHEEVDDLGRCWLADHVLHPHEMTRLVKIIDEMKDVYKQHIAIEEREIFPLALAILSPDDLQLIGNEMAGRRNLRIQDFSTPEEPTRDITAT